MTNFLTQTNSYGVVTGMPTLDNGAVATAQPAVATIPAGLPQGECEWEYAKIHASMLTTDRHHHHLHRRQQH